MRSFLSSLLLFALLLSLAFFTSSCGDDDDNSVALPTEADLTIAGGWGIISTSSNLFGQETEIAALFTEAELADEGYTREELVNELQFVAEAFTVPVDTCVTNNVLTFFGNGQLDYDYSDDCTEAVDLFIFDEDEAPYTWELNERELTITSVAGPITYTITGMASNFLELSIGGDRALSTFGDFVTIRDFGVTFTISLAAQ